MRIDAILESQFRRRLYVHTQANADRRQVTLQQYLQASAPGLSASLQI